MSYEFYITPQEYYKAESIGIKAKTLTKRVRGLAWKKEKAVTTPTRQKRDLSPYYKIAELNGIPLKTFKGRMRRSWDPLRAATQTLEQSKKALNKHWETDRKYPKEYTQRAKENGVSYKQFQWRMTHGWSLEDAANTKKLTSKESSSKAYAKSSWKTGPSLFKGKR